MIKLVEKDKLEFVEGVLKEIEQLYPEEFGETIFRMTSGYGGEIFHDLLYITWSIEGVKKMEPSLTEKQCGDVLSELGREHDANIGINWEVISTTIEMMNSTIIGQVLKR